jgi:hypothetical protein
MKTERKEDDVGAHTDCLVEEREEQTERSQRKDGKGDKK